MLLTAFFALWNGAVIAFCTPDKAPDKAPAIPDRRDRADETIEAATDTAALFAALNRDRTLPATPDKADDA